MTQLATLEKPPEEQWQLGGDAGLRLLEDFRQGRLSRSDYQIDDEPQECA
jgi:hypothetical protein